MKRTELLVGVVFTLFSSTPALADPQVIYPPPEWSYEEIESPQEVGVWIGKTNPPGRGEYIGPGGGDSRALPSLLREFNKSRGATLEAFLLAHPRFRDHIGGRA